jgi:pimeloyl-ACP methyl ester carboxylesterase
VGVDRVIAGSDCGFGTFAGFGAVDPEIAYAKLEALSEGAARWMTEPLLFLPGMMCDASPVRTAGGGPGEGPCHPAWRSHRGVRHGALAEQVLDAAPDRFALAGLSMGGIVAMEVIRQAPGRVTRLALLDTNPRAELPEVQARREPQIDKVRAGRAGTVMREELKPNYLTRGPRYGEILDLCMAMALDLGPEVFERQSIALRDRPDQQETLKSVRVPTLSCAGGRTPSARSSGTS